MSKGPNPDSIFPNGKIKQICFIKNIIKNPNIIVGDYTYYDDDEGAENFEKRVTHHYSMLGDKLIIGRFCAIAKGVTFVMNGANHVMNSISTYPFNIMRNGWEQSTPSLTDLPFKGDTVVGNDVWIGQYATILPGVKIGNGAIIGANAVVAKDIPAYSIAVGNPARVIKMRFDNELIDYLQDLQWWNWTPEKITANLEALTSGNLELIKRLK